MENYISILTGRLFWKIFLWFWSTTIIMILSGFLGSTYFFEEEFRPIPKELENLNNQRLDTLSDYLYQGQEEQAKRLLMHYSRELDGPPHHPENPWSMTQTSSDKQRPAAQGFFHPSDMPPPEHFDGFTHPTPPPNEETSEFRRTMPQAPGQFRDFEGNMPPGGPAEFERFEVQQGERTEGAADHPPEPNKTMIGFLLGINKPAPIEIYVVDQLGRELLQRDIQFLDDTLKNKLFHGQNSEPSTSHALIKSRLVNNQQGKRYLLILHRSNNSNNLSELFWHIISDSTLPVSFLVPSFALSLLVCFWLSWYLSRPIHILKKASNELAKGNLTYKVSPIIGKRRDEIADLGIDFDHMAERIQALLHTQKQLLNDTSHELRSPLARLQIAVSLVMRKTGNISEQELLRISKEVNCLDQLIGRILTVSRLEAQVNYLLDDYIDIADLLKSIISDAQFEAKTLNKEVQLQCNYHGILRSNAELLHHAFDNIIRNALRYTHDNTSVEVSLNFISKQQMIVVSVCDHGDGVPEQYLTRLFEPFFRVDDSRQRSRGGYGLGLAIAMRAIRIHQGNIIAYNRHDKGLCMEISLPVRKE